MLALVLLAAASATAGQVRDLIGKDQWQQAVAEARALVAQAPDSDATTALGEALYRAGRLDEAADVLTPLVAAGDAPARAGVQLGLVRAAEGRDAEASSLIEQAVAKAPLDPWIVYRAAGAAPSRALAVERLEIFLDLATKDDADRVEGARGTIRLYKALGERKVWVPTRRPERVEVPLKPLAGTGGGYYIEASLANRKKIRLLIDTGSNGLFVALRAVAKGGLTRLSEETVFAGGDTGRTESSRGLLARLAIGELEFKDALITTTQDEFDPQGRYHGVLGLNVFDGYRVTLDFKKQRLILEPCEGDAAGAPYWDVNGQMLVRASAADGLDGMFLFDTGAVRSMVGRSMVEALPGARVDRPAVVRTYGGNVASAAAVRGVTIRFLGLESDGGPVYTSDLTLRSRLGGVEVSGFLGMDLLGRTRIVVDTRAHRVDVVAGAAKN